MPPKELWISPDIELSGDNPVTFGPEAASRAHDGGALPEEATTMQREEWGMDGNELNDGERTRSRDLPESGWARGHRHGHLPFDASRSKSWQLGRLDQDAAQVQQKEMWDEKEEVDAFITLCIRLLVE
jgi:hypothetical protein